MNTDLYVLLKSYLPTVNNMCQNDDISSTNLSNGIGVLQGAIVGLLLFTILINNIFSGKFILILYADDTILDATVELFSETVDLHFLITNVPLKICKWLDLNKLCLHVEQQKFMHLHKLQNCIS